MLAATAAWSLVPLVLARHRRELQPLLVIGFALVTGFAAFEVTFAQLVHTRFALPMRQVSLLFVYIGVLAALVQGGLVGRLSRRFSEQRLLLAGLGLTAAGLALVAVQQQFGGLLVVMPVLALGMGLSSPSLSALVSRGAAAGEQGEAMGAFQGIGSLARVAGPFLGELSLGRFGPGSPALGAAALALLAAVAAAILGCSGPEPSRLGHREGVLAGAADRADPVVGQVLPRRAGRDAVLRVAKGRIVGVAAHPAVVGGRGCLRRLDLDLDLGLVGWRGLRRPALARVVPGIGEWRRPGDHLRAGDLADEQRVGAGVQLLQDPGLTHRDGVLGDERDMLPLAHAHLGQLVDLPARPEAEQPDQLHGHGLVEHRQAEPPASRMSWWVRFSLLMAMATRGGWAVTWKTVLAICPFALPPDRAVTMYIPYEIVHNALPSTVIALPQPPARLRLKA